MLNFFLSVNVITTYLLGIVHPINKPGVTFHIADLPTQNTIIHFSQYSHTLLPGNLDTANGKTITGDIWIDTDSKGNPILFHGIYFYQDGSFYQELISDKDQTVKISSQEDYSSPIPCKSLKEVFKTQGLQDRLPILIDNNSLSNSRFEKNEGPKTLEGPSTSSLANQQPSSIYEIPKTINNWSKTTDNITISYGLTMDGIMSTYRWSRNEGANVLVSDYWTSIGNIHFYNKVSFPEYIFQQRFEVQGCNIMHNSIGMSKGLISSENLGFSNKRFSPLLMLDQNNSFNPTNIKHANSVTGGSYCIVGEGVDILPSGSIIGNDCRFSEDPNANNCGDSYPHQCWVVYNQGEADGGNSPYLLWTAANAWDWCNSDPMSFDMGGFSQWNYPSLWTAYQGSVYQGKDKTCSVAHHYETEGSYFLKEYGAGDLWQGSNLYDTTSPPSNY